MKKYKLAIVGATGVVGRTALKVLEEKKFFQFRIHSIFFKKISWNTHKIF